MAACFDPTERLFQSFAPLKEKDFWPFADFLMGSLKPVLVHLLNTLHKNPKEAEMTNGSDIMGVMLFSL